MKASCTIIISHYESLPFLSACVRQIKRYAHPQIRQRIYIVDQSSEDTYDKVLKEFWEEADKISHIKPLWSGYGVDHAVRVMGVATKYICQLHVDAMPVNKNWLYLPIKIIEENNFSFVGQLHFWSRPTDTIYPPEPFFSMSPTFNVAKTETYKEMSEEAGFTRFHNRPQSGLTFKSNDWAEWAKGDYSKRGSDDDTVAFHWEDKYRQHDKLGLAISGYIEPNYGRIIDGIVFHFGSCVEARGVMGTMPEKYRHYTEKINYDYSDELIYEMVGLAILNKPPELEILSRNFWDGKRKIVLQLSEELNTRIESLKNEK